MDLGDLITPEAVIASLRVQNKKQALHEMAEKASKLTGVSARQILETLMQRERLGSTGVGRGIAIPHGRVPQLTRIVSLFARLQEPIEFDALDGEPVDLIFLLLAPEHAGADHLKALARISRLLRDAAAAERLRGAKDRAAIFAVLTEPATSHAA